MADTQKLRRKLAKEIRSVEDIYRAMTDAIRHGRASITRPDDSRVWIIWPLLSEEELWEQPEFLDEMERRLKEAERGEGVLTSQEAKEWTPQWLKSED